MIVVRVGGRSLFWRASSQPVVGLATRTGRSQSRLLGVRAAFWWLAFEVAGAGDGVVSTFTG